MLVDIPAEVDIPPSKRLKDDHGAHILCDPMEDMFNWEYTSGSNTNNMPNPLKRRSRKKKSQGSLAGHLEPSVGEVWSGLVISPRMWLKYLMQMVIKKIRVFFWQLLKHPSILLVYCA